MCSTLDLVQRKALSLRRQRNDKDFMDRQRKYQMIRVIMVLWVTL